MAELDIEYLARIDVKSMYGNLCLSLVVVGIHIFMAIYGLCVFLETRDDFKKGRYFYIVISFVITGLAGLNASLEAVWVFRSLFEATSSLEYLDLLVEYSGSWDRRVSTACMIAMTLVGDSMLVYRCYIIWKDRWWLSILPAVTCLSALALDIFNESSKGADGGRAGDSAGRYTSAAAIFSRVATNVIVTSMIIFYLIRARRGLSKVLPSRNLKLYTGVVALLIESALPVTIFGIMYAIVILCPPKETTEGYAAYVGLSYILSFLFYAFTALSPHMIIFKVTTGRSWVSQAQFPRVDNQGRLSSGIVFAPQGMDSSFIQSVINRDLGRDSGKEGGEQAVPGA